MVEVGGRVDLRPVDTDGVVYVKLTLPTVPRSVLRQNLFLPLLGKAVMALNLAIEGDKAFARVTGGAMESKFILNRQARQYAVP